MTESAMDEKLFTELKKFKVWGIVSWQKKLYSTKWQSSTWIPRNEGYKQVSRKWIPLRIQNPK